MRSILVKILGLLALFNIALWIFFLLTDDYLELEVEHAQNQLELGSLFYAKLVLLILEDEDKSDFERSVEIQSLLSEKGLLGAERLRIYRFEGKEILQDSFSYFDGSKKLKYAPIEVSALPATSGSQPSTQTPIEHIFAAFKPLLDSRIQTDPIVVPRARFSRQVEVIDATSDGYTIRILHPVRSGAQTLALIEAWTTIDIKEAYVGRNNLRLTLLGGMSLLTLMLGLMLAVSIALPLRRLARRLDRQLTPNDIATQLQKFSIKSLQRRHDEIGSLHKNLVKLTTQITRLFDEKERFASDVSHELKNPIASIIAYCENAPIGSSGQIDGSVAKIKQQAIRMNKLVSEISEAAIVDNDLVTKRREKLDLSEVAEAIIAHYGEMKSNPQIKIEASIDKKVIIEGIPDRLGQVIVNLLENAITFVRPVGTIRITLTRHWRRGIRLSIEDSGPGVPDAMRELIFDRFFTARRGSATEENSSGLGLYICKQIVEAHGGTIEVAVSDLGGAAFVIEL